MNLPKRGREKTTYTKKGYFIGITKKKRNASIFSFFPLLPFVTVSPFSVSQKLEWRTGTHTNVKGKHHQQRMGFGETCFPPKITKSTPKKEDG